MSRAISSDMAIIPAGPAPITATLNYDVSIYCYIFCLKISMDSAKGLSVDGELEHLSDISPLPKHVQN
jgi:hypothetical protein